MFQCSCGKNYFTVEETVDLSALIQPMNILKTVKSDFFTTLVNIHFDNGKQRLGIWKVD